MVGDDTRDDPADRVTDGLEPLPAHRGWPQSGRRAVVQGFGNVDAVVVQGLFGRDAVVVGGGNASEGRCPARWLDTRACGIDARTRRIPPKLFVQLAA